MESWLQDHTLRTDSSQIKFQIFKYLGLFFFFTKMVCKVLKLVEILFNRITKEEKRNFALFSIVKKVIFEIFDFCLS